MAQLLTWIGRWFADGRRRGREFVRQLCIASICFLVGALAYAAPAPAPAPADFDFLQPQLETIGDAESIPEGLVSALAQDARGFLWIGSQVGLLRYDGYQFRKFTHSENDPFSLAGDYVVCLMAAKDGRLWVGTNSDGLSRFDPTTERFETFVHDAKNPDSISAGRIWTLEQDANGGVWVGTDHGLDYLPKNSQRFQHFRHDPANPKSLLYDKVSRLLLDRAGRLWVGSTKGLQRLAKNGKDFEIITGDAFTDKNIQTLFQAQDGKLWIGTAAHGAAWVETASPATVHWLPLDSNNPRALSHGWVSGIAQAQTDKIWLATYGGGINIVNASDGRVLQRLRHDPALNGSLALDIVVPLLLDRSGLLWIGTWAGGLQRYNTKNKMVRMLRHSPSLPSGLSRPDVHSMLELPDGRILVGTNGNGIDIVDRQLGLIGGYRFGVDGGLPDTSIYALTQTPDGSLWAGTQQAGVARLLTGSRIWQQIPGLPNPQVKSILYSRDGSLWVATGAGVARLKPEQLTAPPLQAKFEVVPDENGQPLQTRVYALAEDDVGRIWAGSDRGLWVFSPGAKGWRVIRKEAGRAGGLDSELASGLLFDSTGRLWVSSDKGLARLQKWDGRQAQFEDVNTLVGLPDKVLGENLQEDKAGRIWTESALFDPAKKQIMPLGKADGINNGASWSGAYTQTRDGLLLFGGTLGVAIINPAQFQAWAYMPPVVLTGLKINNQAVPLGALALDSLMPRDDLPLLTLTPEQRDFSFEFAALDYSEPKKNRYQYRLQGYDKDWVNADFERRSATYGNLQPGNYTLQVRGSNRLGQWSTQELIIPIQVLPAFWQTGWFLVLMLLLLGSVVVISYRWRVARLHARASTLQKLIDARTADILKLGEIGQELTATLDTEQAFERVRTQVSARLDADVFLIGIVEANNIVFVYKMEHGRRLPNTVASLDEQQRLAALCVREQRELHVNNHDELCALFGTKLPSVLGAPMETVVYLPLLVERQVIGCLSVQSPEPYAYNKDQLEFLRILASYTAIALSNSAAHNALAQSHERLADALLHLKETQAKLIQSERKQISLDLHDNLSQTMTGILLQLDTGREVLVSESGGGGEGRVRGGGLENTPGHADQAGISYIDRAIELARDGITQTRHLLNQLRMKKSQPPPINLVDALRRDLPRLTVGTPIQVSVEQRGRLIPLPATLELVFFRIAQEAVTNALRHGDAKTIRVLLSWEDNRVILTVNDDGCGFDPASPTAAPGIGLLGMHERIAALAGSLEIQSAPGKGTCITATMPLLKEDS